jgi:hypothetical protein
VKVRTANLFVFVGVHQLVLRFINAGDIVEADTGVGLDVDLRLALADAFD